MIKPSKEGSSLGLYKLKNATLDQVKEAFAKSQEAGMTVLAEEYVFGRELTVAVLDMGEGLKAFPIIEIKAPDGDYDFEHKYFSDETVYVCRTLWCRSPREPAVFRMKNSLNKSRHALL